MISLVCINVQRITFSICVCFKHFPFTLGNCLFNCYYSGLVNQYDGDLDYTVPDGHVMRGWTSVHDNHHEYVCPEWGCNWFNWYEGSLQKLLYTCFVGTEYLILMSVVCSSAWRRKFKLRVMHWYTVIWPFLCINTLPFGFLQGKSWRNSHWKMMLCGNKIHLFYSFFYFLAYLYLVVFECGCVGGQDYSVLVPFLGLFGHIYVISSNDYFFYLP